MMNKRGPRLGELCTITDCEHKTAPIQDIGIPLIRTPNIGNGRLRLETVQRISQETYVKWTRRGAPRVGDLIMAREAPVGNVAIVPPNETVCLGQRTVLIRVISPDVESSFLNYLLNSKQIKERTVLLSNGATVGHLNVADIRNFQLPRLPPPSTQIKIAAILAAYDDLIETNQRRIALLEKMAEEIYREWFVRMRFPGYQSTKLVKGMPEGWQIRSIGNLCSAVTDGSHFSPALVDGGKPMASVKDMHEHGFNLDSVKTISDADFEALKKADCQPRQHDVLIAKDGSYLKHVFVWHYDYEIVILSSIAILRPDPSAIRPHFFAQMLKQDSTKSMMSGYVSGSALPRIILKDFKKMRLLIPGRNLMDEYENVAEPIYRQIGRLLETNMKLTKTRDLLLPRLISGKLSVADFDIQFPPSMCEDAKEKDRGDASMPLG